MDKIPFYHSLLRIIHPDPFDFFNAILTGKMGIVVKSAKESGNDGCGVFVQLETGAEFIDRYPSFRQPGTLHIHFQKVGNSNFIEHFLPPSHSPIPAS
jgi:hypothetical protein